MITTLEPISDKYTIPLRDSSPSEFEVQAYLYGKLLALGFEVRGEVKWFDPDLRVQCRFDLVMYDDGRATQIIEVKPAQRKWTKTPLEDTRQGRRYRLFGVPVTFVYGMEGAQRFLEEV